jgi:hypothetical protein
MSGDHEGPNLLALAGHGVHLPVDAEINACGWDGDPVDYEAVFNLLDVLLSAERSSLCSLERPPP